MLRSFLVTTNAAGDSESELSMSGSVLSPDAADIGVTFRRHLTKRKSRTSVLASNTQANLLSPAIVGESPRKKRRYNDDETPSDGMNSSETPGVRNYGNWIKLLLFQYLDCRVILPVKSRYWN